MNGDNSEGVAVGEVVKCTRKRAGGRGGMLGDPEMVFTLKKCLSFQVSYLGLLGLWGEG